MTLTSYTLDLYDSHGTTHIEALPISKDLTWQEEVSHPGKMSFAVPLNDATTADIADRCIVKVSEGGSVKFGCRIASENVEQAVDGRAWLQFDSQPGVLSVLADGVVTPEYLNGVARTSGTDRLFGPMSAEGAWYDPADWAAPVGVNYTAAFPTNLKKKHQDSALVKYNPQWIAPSPGPNVAAASGTIAWFRATVNIPFGQGGDYAVLAAGDDYLEVYADGEQVCDSDRQTFYAWRTVQNQTVSLNPGHHLFAASVENRPSASSGNVLAFVFVLIKLDDNGNPTGTPILMSNSTDWVCTTANVGWHRGQVLLKCVTEAQSRGVAEDLAVGFTMTTDSNGDPWFDDPGQYSIPISTVSLVDVIAQLTESDMDVWLDAGTMTLHASSRLGTDLSDTEALTVGGNVKSFQSSKTVARHTRAYTQLADGTWVTATDTTALATAGLVEVGLQLGTATNARTAGKLALAELTRTSRAVVAPTAETSSLAAPVAGVDYHLGDTVMVPSQRGTSTSKVRVLAITHDRSGDVPRDWPEFVADGSV